MPSDQSTWLIAIPNDGDSEGVIPELANKLTNQSRIFPRENISSLGIPSFKVSLSPSLYARWSDLWYFY
jgi:V-type H+-transporting ATPase subunit C